MTDKFLNPLAEALNISHSELTSAISPVNINSKVAKWHHLYLANSLTILQKVVQEAMWDFIPFLLQRGADVNLQDEDGGTVLHDLVTRRYDNPPPEEVLDQLVSSENINIETSQYGFTALHHAVLFGKWQFIPALVRQGADLNIQTHLGDSPLHNAVSFSTEQVLYYGIEHIDKPYLISLLISEQNISAKNNMGVTPLHLVVHNSQWDIVPVLLQHQASVNIQDDSGNTALIHCFDGNLSSLPELSVIESLIPDEPLQMYKAVIWLLMSVEDCDCRLSVLMHLLQHLLPLQLISVRLDSFGALYLNQVKMPAPLRRRRRSRPPTDLVVEMICHLLQQTCVAKPFSAAVDHYQCGKSYVERIQAMVKALTTMPCSLTKLAILAIRPCILQRKSSGNLDNLGLPAALLSLVKWETLGEGLHEMWCHYKNS